MPSQLLTGTTRSPFSMPETYAAVQTADVMELFFDKMQETKSPPPSLPHLWADGLDDAHGLIARDAGQLRPQRVLALDGIDV